MIDEKTCTVCGRNPCLRGINVCRFCKADILQAAFEQGRVCPLPKIASAFSSCGYQLPNDRPRGSKYRPSGGVSDAFKTRYALYGIHGWINFDVADAWAAFVEELRHRIAEESQATSTGKPTIAIRRATDDFIDLRVEIYGQERPLCHAMIVAKKPKETGVLSARKRYPIALEWYKRHYAGPRAIRGVNSDGQRSGVLLKNCQHVGALLEMFGGAVNSSIQTSRRVVYFGSRRVKLREESYVPRCCRVKQPNGYDQAQKRRAAAYGRYVASSLRFQPSEDSIEQELAQYTRLKREDQRKWIGFHAEDRRMAKSVARATSASRQWYIDEARISIDCFPVSTDSPIGHKVARVTASNCGSGPMRYSLRDDCWQQFSINALSGVVKTANVLETPGPDRRRIVVRVTNRRGDSFYEGFHISVDRPQGFAS